MALSSVATKRSSVTTRLASGRWSWTTMSVPATGPPCRTFPSRRQGDSLTCPQTCWRVMFDSRLTIRPSAPSSPWTAIRTTVRGEVGVEEVLGGDQQLALECIHVASVPPRGCGRIGCRSGFPSPDPHGSSLAGILRPGRQESVIPNPFSEQPLN